MKKTYKKPQIFIESFELAQHIAGCNLTLNSTDVELCNASGTIGKYPSDSWFLSESICQNEVEDYCYTNSYSNLSTINS